MKEKQLYKSIVILLILSLLVPVLGLAQETEVGKYNLDHLVQRGLERNQAIKSAEYSIESIEITRDRANLNLSFIPAAQFFTSPAPMIQYKQALSYDRAYENARDNLLIEIDSTKYDVIKKYQAVINAQENLFVALRDLEHKRSLMDIAVLKKNMGMISDIENNSAIQTYNIAKRNYELKGNELNKAFATLNSAIGFTEDFRYELEPSNYADIEKELKDTDLQYLISLGKDGVIVRMLERGLAQAQFSYNFYVFNDPTEPRPSDAIYEEIKAEESNIAARKNALAESIQTIFFNAQQTQKNYKDLLAKDEIDRKLHEVKEIQYDLGMITKIDFMESEKTLMENEANLLALRNGFNELIYMLNFPHVAGR